MVPPDWARPLAYPRRGLLLFLVAFLVPAAVVAVLAYRTLAQDRELTARRVEDDRRQLTAAVRRELLSRLERLKLAAAATTPSLEAGGVESATGTVLLASISDDRLVLPWERTTGAEEARAVLTQRPFAEEIARGERAELLEQRPAAAVDSYKRAAAIARHPAQAAYAELLLARAYGKARMPSQAEAMRDRILLRPVTIVDELGVPFALYAARGVVDRSSVGHSTAEAAVRAASAAAESGTLSPIAWEMVLAAVTKAAHHDPQVRADAEHFLARAGERTRRFEQAVALQRAFPGILAQLRRPAGVPVEPAWVPFGADTWLVGVAPVAERPSLAVAIDAQTVFSGLETVSGCRASGCGVTLLFNGATSGEPLGPALAGAAVEYRPAAMSPETLRFTARRQFYLTTLVAMAGLSLAGAYLLWRDVRRELRLADMRSQFVSSVSHELKTPLTAIRMFAETLRMGRPAAASQRDDYLDTIVSESERLTRLLNNVLDFSRMEQGRRRYHLAPHDLAGVVRAAARAMQYPLRQQGFELAVDVDDALPALDIDPDAVEQAILNLLANAMKYSGQGRRIELGLRREEGCAVVAVRDCGIGIAPQERRRIFEKFYRAPVPENERIPGTGLGLALVEHIAAAHGGSVDVESTPGAGSVFTIRLPMPPTDAAVAGSGALHVADSHR